MVAGVLFTYPENFRAYKALIAAEYAGSQLTVAPGFVFGETNKTADFLKKFPSGKVPAFESADGKVHLSESNAIAYYVSNETLRGSDDLTKAKVWQWVSWAETDLLPAACTWVFPYLYLMPYNKQSVERGRTDLLSSLNVLNGHLETRTFIVGERVTLADIVVFSNLIHAFKHVLDASVRKQLPNVERWFQTVANQPKVKSVVGPITLCAEPPKYEFKPTGKPTKEKKAEPKKVEKKEAPAASEADAKEAGEAPAPAASSFDMDSFKRVYSNEEETVSIPYFWKHFDPEQYSIWYCEYKYPQELSKVFMSCNLISGMYQRLDKMRKIAFASVCLFGGDNNSTISGVWVWRGHDLAFTQSPDWQIDYESYTWTKLDHSSEETKKLVEQYFSWAGTDKEGRKFNQGKVFK